jgi:16S rRNA (guanine527-N7)-methyltransferase
MLAWGGHLLADEGRWLALKGRADQDEIAGVPDEFRVIAVRQVRVPGTEANRCVIELARSSSRNG